MTTEVDKAGKTVDYWRKRAEMYEDALGFLHPSKKKDLVRRAAGYAGGRESGRRRRTKHMESIYDYPRLKQDDGDVQYVRESTRQNEFCGNCLFFIGRRDVSFGSCSVVEGLIDNAGVCDLWEEIEMVPKPEDMAISMSAKAKEEVSKPFAGFKDFGA